MLRAVAMVSLAVLSFTTMGVATAYFAIQGNIKGADVTALLGTDRPTKKPANPGDPNAGRDLNILLLGSDNRNGENGNIGGRVATGMRSDTTIIMHVSADRSRIELVSIPRDTWVTIPECRRRDGSTSQPWTTKFNAAFSVGGQSGVVTDAAACTIKTVEKMTGVLIDEYVVVDFVGFISMVNALGGVPICVPNDMRSPKAKLNVKAGYQTLDGVTALAYARARTGTGLGNGSDTGRIVRQQQLLAATIHQAQSKNLLTDVGSLYKFLDAATSSLTTSPHLAKLSNVTGLAFSLRGIRSTDITFLTAPWKPRGDGANVELTPAADAIWQRLIADLPLDPASHSSGTSPSGGATSSPGTTDAASSSATAPAQTTKTPGLDAATSACG